MKFYIIDSNDLSIVDEGNNMLELKLICKDINSRFYGKAGCEVVSEEELKNKLLEKHLKER